MTELPIVLAELAACYPRQAFPPDTAKAYVRHLHDLDTDAVARACDRLTHRSEWLPSIAEIRIEVAEERLGLPSPEDAWLIAREGMLRDAPLEVREAADAVGGRYGILRTDRPELLARRFKEEYEARRKRAVLIVAGGVVAAPVELPSPTMRQLPATETIKPRPVVLRWMRAQGDIPLGDPSEEEKRDAIAFLRDGPLDPDNPLDDPLYMMAERIMAECNGEVVA